MQIKRFIGGSLESNGYVICQREGGSCYVIDPGYGPNKFIQYIKEKNLTMQGILLTHHHHDHVGAVGKLKDTFECPVCLHWQDMGAYKAPVEHPLEDGDTIMLEGETLSVIHTPGHTKGSVCFYSEKSKLAFTGDTIFNVDLGRTDLTGGSEAEMIHSCRDIIDQWSNEIYIYPGHGDGCNMKKVRQINLEFLQIVEVKK